MSAQIQAVAAGNRAGQIETHGTDYVPEGERRGSPRSLFAVWAGSNITYLYFVLGGLMVLLGLNVWQAILVILAGNIAWLGVGYLSISGPASGSPSEVIARAFFGVNGNRVVQFVVGWLVGVLYEAINLSVGAMAGFALVEQFMGDAPVLIKILIVVVLAAITFTIGVFGHATILKLGPWFSWTLLAALALLAFFVVSRANFNYVPEAGVLSGVPLWVVAAGGFAIIASGPLSWQVGADYSRYLPAATSSRATALWTALGGFIPSSGIAILGVLAGTVIDMSTPEVAMAQILPPWFYSVFLLVIVIGSVANNALTAYSTGLALLATGVPWKRSVTVIFDAVVAVGTTLYAVLVVNFLDAVSGMLEATLALLAPAMAIYAVDTFLRRNRYDGPALQDTSSRSKYWFHGGFNLGGCGALLIGSFGTFLCLSTTFYTGPITNALGGMNISIFVGAILGGGIYAAVEGPQARRVLHERQNLVTDPNGEQVVL
ncbi:MULTISPECIES: purine-cytosine permease family protein [unclassified Arthrobacter]|uniref:purine-cytosine permease family protein n=1 Tax=unclassified Arthrobacter TaxID=235627 RepID=UPI00254ADC21|nr:cytosine permease [Arthrobacter sp. fls2-241-R2A-172]